jgi:hypothetical protein
MDTDTPSPPTNGHAAIAGRRPRQDSDLDLLAEVQSGKRPFGHLDDDDLLSLANLPDTDYDAQSDLQIFTRSGWKLSPIAAARVKLLAKHHGLSQLQVVDAALAAMWHQNKDRPGTSKTERARQLRGK